MKLTQNDIIAAVRSSKRSSLSIRELMTTLNLSAANKKNLHRQLRELERQRLLVRVKGGRYAPGRSPELLEGIFSLGRRGEGWIETQDGRRVRISERFRGAAADGDRVRYTVLRRDRMNRLNGKVVSVVERSGKLVVGVYQPGRTDDYVLPVDASFNQPLLVDRGGALDPQPGHWVVVRPVTTSARDQAMRGELVDVLGDPADPKVEMMAAACRFSIPLHFPDSVLREAAKADSYCSAEELAGRQDLRDLPFVTIDGETARDFDDAVAVVPLGDGFRLWVAIADVSHYVQPGSVLDRAAYERGTSVYFPGYCIPMLPEKLSNDVCSLNPEVERLVMVAEICFSRQGVRSEATFYPGVIQSRARLTYTQVEAYLNDPEKSSLEERLPHLDQLLSMRKLAELLTAMRQRRGALELDIPEPVAILDSLGHPLTIRYAERLASHRIIEEFMLAANEAVADYLERNKRDFPFRIHEPPEAADFAALNNHLVAHGRRRIDSGHDLHADLQQLIRSIDDEPQKRVISRMLLQSLKQARYSVDNVGHYGLAAEKYCHFTSPIRRYPDLLVHRVLKQCLLGEPPDLSREKMAGHAEFSSRRERLAVDAERDVQAMLACRFMLDKVGDTYAGTISSVQKFGLFVELADYPVEGLVHIARLEDDYYQFDAELNRLVGERTGRLYTIGNSVHIYVENVNIARREIDFTIAGTGQRQQAVPGPKRGRRRKEWR